MSHPLEKKEFLSRGECATYLAHLGYPISVGRLNNLASNNNAGGGPPFNRVRWSRVYYRRVDVEEWVKKNTEHVA